MLKKTNYTTQEIKLAYQIVQEDLFNSLLSAKNGQSIKLSSLGKLTKKEQKQRCG
jgi:nucleoid DNA-binding protein